MRKSVCVIVLLGFTMLCHYSCVKDEPDDPVIPNEEEIITTLFFNLTPEDGDSSVVLSFQDLDGDGGNPPIIASGDLSANSTYRGSIELFNELEQPAVNITDEVKEEAEAHQFFFSNTVDGLQIGYNDADMSGNPLGLATIVTTTSAGAGSITIVLRHEPDKSASGVSDGEITNAGGETDLEVTFDVKVQ